MTKKSGAIDYNVPLRLPIDGGDPEALFRRLIEFSYAVGRQYRADGGSAEEPGAEAGRFVREELARPSEVEQAKIGEIVRPSPLLEQYGGYGAREAVRQNVSRPMPTASEFVRHQLKGNEPQLPQMDREAYQKMKEYSVLPLELAAYEIPGAGQALAAVDLARGLGSVGKSLREGDKADIAGSATEAGLAASGARGRLAKAAAAVMAGLMPEEAEAGVIHKAMNAIRAYHGSPHTFDRFDMSKIGTGEGAQAYGHGLYFAENENIAKGYRDRLAKSDASMVRPDDEAVSKIKGQWDDIVARRQKIFEDTGGRPTSEYFELSDMLDALNHQAVQDTVARKPYLTQGSMYEVDIQANPEHLLDWDRTLSGQSEFVKKALEKTGIKQDKKALQDFDDALLAALEDRGPSKLPRQPPDPLGANIYESGKLVPGSYRDPVAASQTLREIGIPGIKYLDAGSRGAGEGSRNYVIFDDNLIDILRRYAQGGEVEREDYAGGGSAIKNIINLAQKITSADTSIKQVPALLKSKHLEVMTPEHRNIDIGGGRFDLGTEYLRGRGVESHVLDPFNRPQEHNEEIIRRFSQDPAHSATIANVLNVIAEPEARRNVIQQARDLVAPGGKAYFGIYEGDRSGLGRATSKGWQENRPAASYEEEIAEMFPGLQRFGNIIIAPRREAGGEVSREDYDKGGGIAKALKIVGDVISKPAYKRVHEIASSPDFNQKAFAQAIKDAETEAMASPRRITTGQDVLNRNPNIDPNISLSNAGVPFSQHYYEWTPTGILMPKKEADLADLVRQRALVTPVLGDITPAETITYNVGGVELFDPTIAHGGGPYMRSRHAIGPNPSGWASRDVAASKMYNKIIENAKIAGMEDPLYKDSPIIMSHTVMGYPAVDSTHVVRHNVLGQIEAMKNSGKFDQKVVDDFDELMRKKFGEQWPGLLNTSSVEEFLAPVGKRTSTFVQALDTKGRLKAGLPDVGAARFAAMHPKLMGTDQMASGYSMSILDPVRGTTKTGLGGADEIFHPTYDRTFPSLGYIGGTKYQVPYNLMFPDWAKAQKAEYVEKKTGQLKPMTDTMHQQSMMTQLPVQRATQEWLDNIMSHVEKEKKAWGYKEGGKTRMYF